MLLRVFSVQGLARAGVSTGQSKASCPQHDALMHRLASRKGVSGTKDKGFQSNRGHHGSTRLVDRHDKCMPGANVRRPAMVNSTVPGQQVGHQPRLAPWQEAALDKAGLGHSQSDNDA